MATTINNEFENRWNDFLASFKGSMVSSSRRQEITLPIAKSLLQEAAMSWSQDYNLNGAWLRKLMRDYPKKGNMVREILLEDMTVEMPPEKSDNTNAIRYGIPVGTGLASLAAASLLSAGTATVIGSAVAGAAIGYVFSKSKIDDMKEKKVLGTVDDYGSQLEKYRNSIVSILMAEDTPTMT